MMAQEKGLSVHLVIPEEITLKKKMRRYVYEIKNDVGDVSMFEVKQIRENIDITQDFDEIISDLE